MAATAANGGSASGLERTGPLSGISMDRFAPSAPRRRAGFVPGP